MCEKSFLGTDEGIYKHLPPEMQSTIPFRTFGETKLDKNLLVFLKSLIISGQSFRGFRKLMIEARYPFQPHVCHSSNCRAENYRIAEFSYLSFQLQNFFNGPIYPFLPADETPFGVVPSEDTLSRCYKLAKAEYAPSEKKMITNIGGTIIKLDHTFKVASLCNMKAQFTIMNENNEIAAYWLTTSQPIAEVEEQIKNN